MEETYYIEFEGYADTVLAIIKVKAKDINEAYWKAADIYMRDYGVYNLSKESAEELAETNGIEIIDGED